MRLVTVTFERSARTVKKLLTLAVGHNLALYDDGPRAMS